MNRGLLQSSPVQQMMAAGNPIWWSLNNIRPPSHQHQQPSPFFPPPLPPNSVLPHFNIPTTTSSSSSSSPSLPFMEQEQLPESWSQLLLGGLVGEEEKASEAAAAQEGGFNDFLANNSSKKMENNDKNSWEDRQALVMHHHHNHQSVLVDHVKQENSSPTSYVYHQQDHQFQAKPNWSGHHPQLIPASSSPHESCVDTFNSNKMLDFSTTTTTTTTATTKSDARHLRPIRSDPSSESNSTATNGGGALKKAKVQHSSTQSPFKVRKEKLGDRITALHQLVSPFGKTDTASVLLEAIGYIRFLQSQIEALSLPYLSSGSANKMQSHSVQGERNCIFPEDPGQLLNDNCLKRKGGPDQEYCQEEPKDLRSRGLCLVPVSCTLHVGNDNGADYWAPALGGGIGGGFR